MGATGFKKKRQRMLQNLIKIVPTRSSRKSQRDALSPDGNTSPRNSTEKAIPKEETTDDIEGDPHEAASSLLSSVHKREESTKEDAAAIRIQAFFRGHRVRLSNPTAFSFAIFYLLICLPYFKSV